MHPSSTQTHPRSGPHAPASGPPPRLPGTVRRTTSIDMRRPDGLEGPLMLHGLGRDLVTHGDGTSEVRGEASFDMSVAFLENREITSISTRPDAPAAQDLVGARAAGGFRKQLDAALPEDRDAHTLLYQLLDDIPGAALVSGYSVGRADVPASAARSGYQLTENQCSGFRHGGTIMIEVGRTGRAPVVTGPEATPLTSADDSLAWHAMDDLGVHSMRRQRLLDVARDPADPRSLRVSSLFRDSHVAPDGRATVIHEYEVSAWVDCDEWRVREASATPHVLPWTECPSAAASATRLAGVDIGNLRRQIRTDFRGISTCTHLNDQLRSLADVVALAQGLPPAVG
ncbi:DUF2889 domain-containing protein [Streptomyces sp. NPDC096311]|uniref:DUF2889 domain-containing protein n=1 Tax=Streptomyces sp. NPDC096311 TaxID=3366083 RepID=UPI00381A6DCA